MRYIIDSDKDIQELIGENATIVDSYEPIERLSKRVEKLGRSLAEYKASGIDWAVLVFYLKGKGIQRHVIDRVLRGVEEFFRAFDIERG